MGWRLGFVSLWICGLTVGCSDEPPVVDPEWIDLAQSFVPEAGASTSSSLGLARHLGDGTAKWSPVDSGQDGLGGRAGGWVTERVSASAWEAVHPRIWHTETEWSRESQGDPELRTQVIRAYEGVEPQILEGFKKDISGAALAEDEADFDALLKTIQKMLPGEDLAGGFLCHGRHLWLFLDEGDEPGDGIAVRSWVDLGEPGERGWRVSSGPYAGRGVALLPGTPESLTTSIPPASVLRFEPLLDPGGLPGQLQVGLDGLVLWEGEIGVDEASDGYAIELPQAGRASAKLTFTFGSKAGRLVLLEPIIGPKEVGTYAARPWARTRPDLVLVSVDTYRADNLAHNGGDPRWAPHLNQLANTSLCFTEARSPATWTLPAHAALLTARMPRQVDMSTRGSRLSIDVETLADRFTEAGYRVAAITERGFVSRAYGLDQGFGRFEEHKPKDARTLQGVKEAFARDDGRPLLLLVHSYRAHDPFEVSAKAREALSVSGSPPTPQTILGWRKQLTDGASAVGEVADSLAQLRDLYRGAAYDMDALFGQFMVEFEAAGILGSGYLATFSDHGESFGEHGVIGHGTGVWEEEARIPLMLTGPGIKPELRAGPATLLDLPRTLAALASIEPSPQWAGVNLLAGEIARPVAVFQCGTHGGNYAAIVEGSRKIILSGDRKSTALGPAAFAYDLATDPEELAPVDLASGWPVVLDRRLRPVLEHLSRAQSAAEAATLDGAHVDELRAMGYAGGDE